MSTPNVPLYQQEFEDRITKFANGCGLTVDVVREELLKLGINGAEEDGLSCLDDEDALPMSLILKTFVDSGLALIVKVRRSVKFLRGKFNREEVQETVSGGLTAILQNLRPQEQWTDEELVAKYSETEVGIAHILKDRSRGQFFVVFNSDGSVNQEATLKMLKIARRQNTNEHHRIDGIGLVKLWRAGVFPNRRIEASPFCPTVALVDGYCATTDTSWAGIPFEKRILMHCYWVFANGKLSAMDLKKMNDDARTLTIEELREKYARGYVLQRELEDSPAGLPKLILGESSRVLHSTYNSGIDTGFGG